MNFPRLVSVVVCYRSCCDISIAFLHVEDFGNKVPTGAERCFGVHCYIIPFSQTTGRKRRVFSDAF